MFCRKPCFSLVAIILSHHICIPLNMSDSSCDCVSHLFIYLFIYLFYFFFRTSVQNDGQSMFGDKANFSMCSIIKPTFYRFLRNSSYWSISLFCRKSLSQLYYHITHICMLWTLWTRPTPVFCIYFFLTSVQNDTRLCLPRSYMSKTNQNVR